MRTAPEVASAPAKRNPTTPGLDQAVCSAEARLNEGWILPETKCHPAIAAELAAFLCAYGV